jgi:hypothetical protein
MVGDVEMSKSRVKGESLEQTRTRVQEIASGLILQRFGRPQEVLSVEKSLSDREQWYVIFRYKTKDGGVSENSILVVVNQNSGEAQFM